MIRVISRFIILLIFIFSTSSSLAAENPLKVRASIIQGYDNNTGLNAERKGDHFTQESASVLYKNLLNSKNQVRLSYNALNSNYYEATDLDLLLNEVGAGISHLLTPNTIWETDYSFQYLDFSRNEAVTSFENKIRTGFRHKFSDVWMLRGGYTFSYRDYVDRKLRQPSREPSLEDERADSRNSIDAQLSYKWRPNILLNAGTVLYRSDSNDQFNDFYDYDAYRYYAGATWQIDAHWLLVTKFTYELRDYSARPIVSVPDEKQADDIYTTNLSLYYKVNSKLTIGSSYTYKQKDSNEPSQQYSGSLGTLGLFYSF